MHDKIINFPFILSLFFLFFYNSSTSTNQRKPWKVPPTWCATSNASACDDKNHIERVQFWYKVVDVVLIKEKGYGSTCLVFDQRIILLSGSYASNASQE